MSKNNLLAMHFSWFPLSLLWKLWADTLTANFNTHLNKQHVIRSGRKHSPLASYSFHGDHSLLFSSWESINSEWTWDDSYKLFPNLVISHFHAVMDIGLQAWWECREDGLQKKFSWFDMISLECMACCSVDCHLLLICYEVLTYTVV